ncbi:MAG TPA: hypothetical protein VF306_19605, partial [Pirellulales bacterium]
QAETGPKGRVRFAILAVNQRSTGASADGGGAEQTWHRTLGLVAPQNDNFAQPRVGLAALSPPYGVPHIVTDLESMAIHLNGFADRTDYNGQPVLGK